MREDYADNLEEYRNPSLYDLENSLEETELAFFAHFTLHKSQSTHRHRMPENHLSIRYPSSNDKSQRAFTH